MKDTIEIHDQGGAGRMVHLVNNPALYQTPPPPLVTDQDMYYQQQQMVRSKLVKLTVKLSDW